MSFNYFVADEHIKIEMNSEKEFGNKRSDCSKVDFYWDAIPAKYFVFPVNTRFWFWRLCFTVILKAKFSNGQCVANLILLFLTTELQHEKRENPTDSGCHCPVSFCCSLTNLIWSVCNVASCHMLSLWRRFPRARFLLQLWIQPCNLLSLKN